MNAVILKYDTRQGNYWGNEAHPNGVGIQTLASIAQATLNVAAVGGDIYLYRVGTRPQFYGPMRCAPEIAHVRGSFYRPLLIGDTEKHAPPFLDGAMTARVQKILLKSEAVLIQGRAVRGLHFGDPQPATLQLASPFVVVAGS